MILRNRSVKIVVILKNMTPRTKDDVMPAGGKRLRCDSSVRAESSPGTLAVSGPSLRDRNELPSPDTASPVGTQSSCAFYYNEDSYIVRQGEPLDRLLLITQGIAWKFTTIICEGTSVCSSQGEYIENGHFIGEALLEWGCNGFSLPNLSNLPTSPHTVKTHTKVEAFALMAKDLKTLVSRAALVIQRAWRRRYLNGLEVIVVGKASP
ncbi:Cyclic nucleotide-gated ion channel 1 [Morella rubra]|uniref:Cyclic nucleotide-gated ion channel 1 n=1 Tax=Morella rubra TaxID=262757 RepID=A0A6A1VQU6_9ROSI|nr:Cyclic nucleotide-gated ion channel 1 [Morella rubra]